MPFDPNRCYRIISHHSGRCVERTEEFGVLQISAADPANNNQIASIAASLYSSG